MPTINPVLALIDAIPGADELHVPPRVVLTRIVASFWQSVKLPVIAVDGFTIMVVVEKQPPASA